LLLRHGHADGDASLFGRWPRRRIVAGGENATAPFGRDFTLVAHRGRRGIGHRHRTTYARLGLYHQEFKCRMQHMSGLDAAPGDRGDASLDPKGHERMISGMKLYLVDALPIAVKGLELWRIAIGLHCPTARGG
jgi:hypothetical protein